jgi:hypothetical protein
VGIIFGAAIDLPGSGRGICCTKLDPHPNPPPCRGRGRTERGARERAELAALTTAAHRGNTVDPIRNLSTACAACRPSRIAHTTSDWPRLISPAANTLGLELT